jgi:murein DD-endopeptidase MepM/ murein hydrolase activator NlpD
MRVMGLGGAVGDRNRRFASAVVMSCLVLAAVSGCSSDRSLDWDLRNNGSSTAGSVERATAARPQPDANGVISYPGYQVVVAKRGDTVASLAARVGLSGTQLASFNALKPDNPLRAGEVLALPVRVSAANVAASQPVAPGSNALDVSAIATTALDRVEGSSAPLATAPFSTQNSGPVPVRYQVQRGETAFSIARQFDISAKALADWNGLGPDLAVREGQYLIIPTAQDAARLPVADATLPGQGSPLAEPPSASQPLPDEPTPTASQVAASLPASPDLSAERSASSAAQFVMPIDGSITRGYKKKVNDGIDIAAAAGAPIKAAAAGVVAAVTKDPSGNPILVLKHSGGLLTVYTGIASIAVAQGSSVSRGQTIAKASGGTMHFEVRQGLESVDPLPYLQ